MENKKTLVIGGSPKPDRYSNKAIRLLLKYGYPVVSTGAREAEVEGVKIQTGTPPFEDIHTVTLYVGPARQPQLYDYVISLKPKRIIFNPGTENDEFIELARKNNIETVENCTLVMLNSGLF
ncbi:MAG: CoA-binding protein [Chlorobi bacterium]|nr:CoA-binding protein [Chlorobiota bacterium]